MGLTQVAVDVDLDAGGRQPGGGRLRRPHQIARDDDLRIERGQGRDGSGRLLLPTSSSGTSLWPWNRWARFQSVQP